jgi:hypothetical protein
MQAVAPAAMTAMVTFMRLKVDEVQIWRGEGNFPDREYFDIALKLIGAS